MEPPDVNNTRETPGKAPRSPGAGTLTCPAYAPGSGGLPSSPTQVLRGSGILIKTKNLTKDPLPFPRCTRSPRRGNPESLQKSGSHGERRGAAATPASPGGSAGAGRSPVTGGPSVRKSSAGSFRSSPAGTEARWLRRTAGRPLPAGETKRNETKQNERKRKTTKGNTDNCGIALPTQLRVTAVPGCPPGPARSAPTGPGCRRLRGPIRRRRSAIPLCERTSIAPAAASWAGLQIGRSRGYLRGHWRRDRGCRGMRSRPTTCTSHGYSPAGTAGSPSAAGGCGVAEANLPSATRSGPGKALAGPCRWRGEAGPAGSHMSAPAGAGPSRVRAGAGGARPGGGPYLPIRA